jgi:hypothetical protein
MEEGNEHDRRKEDRQFAHFMGEIEEWKATSIEWREKTDRELKAIADFMEEVRTPRKIIIWTVRAILVSALTGIAASLVAFVKGHIHIQ